MIWVNTALAALLINAATSQSIGCNCKYPAPKVAQTIAPTIATAVVPTIAPTVVDGNVVQSLIDTIQLFIVSDLIAETLPEKKVAVPVPAAVEPQYFVDYDDCDILQYEFVYDTECPDFVTGMAPKCVCKEDCDMTCPMKCDYEYVAVMPKKCVNCGLNQELILPPYASELPCGLGYLPGGLPMVAKAFAPCSKCYGFGYGGCGCGYDGCGCGCSRSAAALPICSPYSCAALAVPLCPDFSPLVKPIIL